MSSRFHGFMYHVLLFCCPLLVNACWEGGAKPEPSSAENAEVNKERGDNFYGIKSGIITYSTTGNYQDSEETFYFDDWGDQEARFQKVTDYLPGTRQVSKISNKLIIRSNGVRYSLDLDAQTGNKTKVPPREPRYSFEELVYRLGSSEKVAEYLSGRGIVMLGEKEKVLGFPCQVMRIPTSRTSYNQIWFYEGLVLRSNSVINAGNSTLTTVRQAIRFEPNADIDPIKFSPPVGFPVENINEIVNMLAK